MNRPASAALLLSLFLCPFILSACASAQPCVDPLGCLAIAPQEPIRIGVLLPLSSSHCAEGPEALQALRLAQDGLPLLKGHPIELLVTDLSLVSSPAQAAVDLLTDPGVLAVFNLTCQGMENPIPQIVTLAGASSQALTLTTAAAPDTGSLFAVEYLVRYHEQPKYQTSRGAFDRYQAVFAALRASIVESAGGTEQIPRSAFQTILQKGCPPGYPICPEP